MKAKLIVEGREFPVEINDPELEKLVKPPKKTGYERVDGDKKYYTEVSSGRAFESTGDLAIDVADQDYEYANYYSDRTVAENNARADKLMRQLRRFAVEHCDNTIDWYNSYDAKYYIGYSYKKKCLDYNVSYAYRAFGHILFDTTDAVKLAIETFRDELTWYFTEYKDSL